MYLLMLILCPSFLGLSLGAIRGSPVPLHRLPFSQFLLQEPAFRVENRAEDDSGGSDIAAATVPLVMKLLFDQAEMVENGERMPQNGDFKSLARSIQPINLEELGIQRVILDFPTIRPDDIMPGGEAWLVFQLKQSHVFGNNCTQMLTVYENNNSKMQALVTVPLNYQDGEPLVMVNITRSLRGWRTVKPSYVVYIKDSTSYTRDKHLYSFSNYIDCSLARACEVLELHNVLSSPVLLLLSPELAAKKILESEGSEGQGRFRRSLDSSEYTYDQVADSSNAHTTVTPEDDSFCHFQEWTVNTEQLGWDWLVFPERIPLNTCTGKCPVLIDRKFNATSHAVARGLHRMVLGPGNRPAPCCVPVKYKKFTMLIEKAPGMISLETSQDLSASQCGCR